MDLEAGHGHFSDVRLDSSLARSLDGLPLGLAAVKFGTRQRFKGSDALKP